MTMGVAFALVGPVSFLVIRIASESLRLADQLITDAPGVQLQIMQSAHELWLRVQSRFPALHGADPIQSLNAGILSACKQMAAAAGALAGNLLALIATVAIVLLALSSF
jgi:hypothetical protein